MSVQPPTLTIGQCASLACLLEVTAPKPGNVHRGADFEDVTFRDFVVSAIAIERVMEDAQRTRLGQTVLAAIRATRTWVASNTNLGIVLLLAPLASVDRHVDLQIGLQQRLAELNDEDCRLVYEAIRLAAPGGLGQVDQADVADSPPTDLLAAMRIAASRDMIAKQYVTRFHDIFAVALPTLLKARQRGGSLEEAIVYLHVSLMSQFPDSLIGRKCGPEVAEQSAALATSVLQSGQPGDQAYLSGLGDLDFWLRSDGHRRNPGTTADLVTATLFVALRDGLLDLSSGETSKLKPF